jgi:hypothetical protein
VRLADAEGRGRLLLGTGRRRRRRYAEAAGSRRAALGRRLRGEGVESVWLRADAEPLRVLARFFRARGDRRRRPLA